MAQEINLLDPLGIAKVVRGQVNQMATQAKLPPLPALPTVNVQMGALPFSNLFNKGLDRPGFGRGDRAG